MGDAFRDRTGDLLDDRAYPGLVLKLHPRRWPNLSPRMIAILGHIVDQEWTEPQLGTLAVTVDGCVVSAGTFVGSASDYDRNLAGVLEQADLDQAERRLFNQLRAERVDDHRHLPQVTTERVDPER